MYVLIIFPFILYYKICILFLFLVSLIVYYTTYKSNRNYNYYILLPRIWEIIIGSMKLSEKKYYFKNISLILMILYCLLLEKMKVYDQFVYVILTVTFLQSNDNLLIQSMMSRVLCHIGNMSYILYLIHYPLVKISTQYYIIKLIIICEIVYQLFEKPIINYTKDSNVKIISNIVIFYSIVLVFYTIIMIKQNKLKAASVNVLGIKNITLTLTLTIVGLLVCG